MLSASAMLHGAGMGGSRAIGGTSEGHTLLEERLAEWHGKERAVIFSSGYVSNFETLSAIIGAIPDLVVFSDSLNHRSLIEGIRSSAKVRLVFKHNDLKDLENQLSNYGYEVPKLIVFESIYSMSADFAPIKKICDLADHYGALTFVDETHAIGTHGATGAGVCEEIGETRETFIQGVFGKSLGTLGGYVAGPETAMDYVRLHAPGYIFTTALPHAVIDATIKSLEIVQKESSLREKLRENSRSLKSELRKSGIKFIDESEHIIPVLIPGSDNVKIVAQKLFDNHGIYVQPIVFPSVAIGEERIRITAPPYRTQEQIKSFVSALQECLNPRKES